MFQIRDYAHCEPDAPDIDDLMVGDEQPHSDKSTHTGSDIIPCKTE